MEIIRIPRIMHETCWKHRVKGRSVGFVPTMGALHDGHISLVKRSRMENDLTVVSIFVNPLQFGPSEDFDKYPRDMENDLNKLRSEEVDSVFLPDNSLMYPAGHATSITVTGHDTKLCGHFRPGHFTGVATVVAKLLNIVSPTRAYFGQKDFQQTVIIKQMARDLNMDVEIVVCPIIREPDGLAMSSRNRYLDEAGRKAALAIHATLTRASDMVRSGSRSGSEITALM